MAGFTAMRRPSRRSSAILAVALILAVAVTAGLIASHRSSAHERRAAPASATVALTVSDRATARPIPAGFLGLSLEYPAVLPYAGADPRAINPVFVQLIRNLTPGQAPSLRIGGDTT